MPHVKLSRIDHRGGPSLWEARVLIESDQEVVRYGRSVAYALRKLADAVNLLEQPQVIEEMRRTLKAEQIGQEEE